jgi:hypothetical protein
MKFSSIFQPLLNVSPEKISPALRQRLSSGLTKGCEGTKNLPEERRFYSVIV